MIKEVLLFSYKECKIVSAVPIADIKAYLHEIGAKEADGLKFDYTDLKIEITAHESDTYPDLGIPRHTITVHGERATAEDFLTAFRFRFLSAGG